METLILTFTNPESSSQSFQVSLKNISPEASDQTVWNLSQKLAQMDEWTLTKVERVQSRTLWGYYL